MFALCVQERLNIMTCSEVHMQYHMHGFLIASKNKSSMHMEHIYPVHFAVTSSLLFMINRSYEYCFPVM